VVVDDGDGAPVYFGDRSRVLQHRGH
jgi:hypothetical protein